MTDLSTLKFFATPAHSCSYIDGREAITLFADPSESVDIKTYNALSELGFRRSGSYLYRPHCRDCQACIAVRIPVQEFVMSRSQKRIHKRNNDLEVSLSGPSCEDEYYQLYQRYISARHSDGDMYPPDQEQFQSFLGQNCGTSRFISFRYPQGNLAAVAVLDKLPTGLSAIYTFYDPDAQKRSLGVYAVLWQIQYSTEQQLDFVYLGYWIKECQKMSYKTDYRPLQLFVNDQWQTMPQK